MEYKRIRSFLNYETLSKLFFDLADERYPSSEKMKQLVAKLVGPMTQDPLENIHFKIAALTIMRNMVKEVSPAQLYRSIQHRDDLHAAIIEALESLEDSLDELYEKAEEEKEEPEEETKE